VSVVVSPEQQDLNARIEKVRKTITQLKKKVSAVDAELDAIAAERERYEILNEICQGLDKLDGLGAADLFWGKQAAAQETQAHLTRVRGLASDFIEKIAAIEQRRESLQNEIQEQLLQFDLLSDALLEQQEREERSKYEFVVDREFVPPPYHPPVMPWEEEEEDQRRFRRLLLACLLWAILFGQIVSIWTLPLREPLQVAEVPERLVKLVERQRPKPPPPKPPEEKKPEKEPEKKKTEEKPKPSETQVARKKAEKAGVLAFKNTFEEIMNDPAAAKLGADARIKDTGKQAVGDAKRSLVVAKARQGSGGINTSAISRNVAGTGTKVSGVQFTRVESSVGADMKEADRPLSEGPGPSRTDEEIQIVFDRYKATLYRIYNRELRKDPRLQGKMVLRLTIQPDGRVSACAIESTDMQSDMLKREVVARVKRFNFGPKEDVPPVTILYPIDFLPAV
jgi:outer membrane biosynthesis protein TonB